MGNGSKRACSLSAAKAIAILVKRIHRLKSKSIFFFYRLLQAVLSPLVLLYFLLRSIRNRRYLPTLIERLGILPREYQQTVCGAIWFHAVSVGEVIAISPLMERVRQKFPCAPIFVSTATLA